VLSPALYDSHIHLRDMLQDDRETLESGIEHMINTGTLGGGAQSNTNPPLDNAIILDKYVNGDGDFKGIKEFEYFEGFAYGLLTPNSTKEELEKMKDICNNKYKAFQSESVGSGFFIDNEKLKEQIMLLPQGAEIRIHCEDPNTLEKNKHKWDPTKPQTHIKARPDKAEARGIQYIIEEVMPLRQDLKYVICHVSSKKGVKKIEKGKKKYDNLYCETGYHYLYFDKKHYKTKGVKMKCNPSIKKRKDRRALIKALNKGLIDYLISDHAPHTWEDKMEKHFSGLPSYNAGVFGYLINQGVNLENLIKAATKEEYEIKEGNLLRAMILNLKGRTLKAEYQKTKAREVNSYNDEILPYPEKVLYGNQVIAVA